MVKEIEAFLCPQMGKKATWPYVPRSAMALSVRLKTKVLPAYREHNMRDLNTASEF